MATEQFDSGLSAFDRNCVEDIACDIGTIIASLEDLDRHRSYSLAITKLEEARFWLLDRKSKPAGG